MSEEHTPKTSAEDQFLLAQCYQNGKGVTKNLDKAIGFYQSALDRGHIAADLALQLCFQKIGYAHIAKRYENGTHGMPKDRQKALKYYQKSAAEDEQVENRSLAQYELGLRYENGLDDLPENIENALHLYKLATEYGPADAAFRAAKILELGGREVKRDEKAAFRYYQLAVEKAHSEAPFELGRCFENGMGTQINYLKAKYWYGQVKDENHSKASEAIDRLDEIESIKAQTYQKSSNSFTALWGGFFGHTDVAKKKNIPLQVIVSGEKRKGSTPASPH